MKEYVWYSNKDDMLYILNFSPLRVITHVMASILEREPFYLSIDWSDTKTGKGLCIETIDDKLEYIGEL